MGQNNYPGTLQQPMSSGFNATSTTREVIKGIDLTGKIALVTAGNAGNGLEANKVLETTEATVIIPDRDVEKARKIIEGIPNVELGYIDFIDPASIAAFAEAFIATGRPHHLLINNAGYYVSAFAQEQPRN